MRGVGYPGRFLFALALSDTHVVSCTSMACILIAASRTHRGAHHPTHRATFKREAHVCGEFRAYFFSFHTRLQFVKPIFKRDLLFEVCFVLRR